MCKLPPSVLHLVLTSLHKALGDAPKQVGQVCVCMHSWLIVQWYSWNKTLILLLLVKSEGLPLASPQANERKLKRNEHLNLKSLGCRFITCHYPREHWAKLQHCGFVSIGPVYLRCCGSDHWPLGEILIDKKTEDSTMFPAWIGWLDSGKWKKTEFI